MSNFNDLKQAINNDLNRDDLVDVVADYVARAIRHYQRDFFYKTETIIALDTNPGTVFYDVPDELVSITYIRLNQSGVWIWLRKVPYEFILGLDSLVVPTRSLPSIWAPFDSKIRLYNAPDKVYMLELTGNARIPVPLNDTDSNFWTNEALDMITFATLALIYRTRIKNQEMAAMCDGQAEQYRLDLMGETIDKSQRQFAVHW